MTVYFRAHGDINHCDLSVLIVGREHPIVVETTSMAEREKLLSELGMIEICDHAIGLDRKCRRCGVEVIKCD